MMEPNRSKAVSQSVALFAAMALLTSLFSGIGHPVKAAPGDITRISVDSSGLQANSSSKRVSISADGRFVAFESDASNLVPSDTNASTDIFVRDRQTSATTRVSVTPGGAEANGGSAGTAISTDGRFVAFTSDATNLVSNDTNNTTDIFVKDRQTGTVLRASVSSTGEGANDLSDFPLSISGDGRFIVFLSDATNLVPGDTNGITDIFIHDNQTGATERVSVANDGGQANSSSFSPSMSANGQFVTFTSGATNLVINDTNNRPDVFVRDRLAGTTTRVSINSAGQEASLGALEGSISGNGRYVAFSSAASNLIPQETSGFDHIYVHDRQTGITSLASIFSDGFMMAGSSFTPSLSFDGRYVTFQFDDRGDGQALHEIYVRDRLTGATLRATRGGTSGEESSFGPMISSDGRVVAFWSLSNRLVPNDTNATSDAFAYEVGFGPDLIPSVLSIGPTCGAGCTYPTASSISFRVTFSESVTGVGIDDFVLTAGGAVTAATVTEVSGSSNVYFVTVNTGSGEGNLRLDLVDNDSIQDITPNPLGGIGAGNGNFTAGEILVVDRNVPAVNTIHLTDGSPTSANIVHFGVTMSEPVNGVDVSDFVLTISGGISGATVTEVNGSGNAYNITVNSGTGDGTIRFDLSDNDSIVDQVNNPLGGSGAGNGSFVLGDTYSFNRTAPVVTSILRADPNPTAATTIHFTVSFSEPVVGVDASDFVFSNTGNVTGANVTSVDGSGNIYIVTAGTGSGNGTIRLDVSDNDSILDAFGLPLGGTGTGNGNFTSGETYTINRVPLNMLSLSLTSNGTNDGWALESGENTNLGSSKNATDTVIRLGDDHRDRQYRAILHFPTYYLPDNAVVTEALLMIKVQGVVGTNPFATHGGISIDIRAGVFGNFGPFGLDALQTSDFQNPASMDSAGVIPNSPNGNWYWTLLSASSNQFINLTGNTQVRLAFQLDDNDDLGNDYLTFFSGDYNVIPDRPHLVIKYYLP